MSDHSRVIVHIDIDCFYVQVEELHNPDLRSKNVAIKQKSCLVTCNYNARQFGVQKLMSVSEALKCCPDLVLVNGEDLTKYKAMSDRIFDVLSRFTTQIEKLGMDENFIDVTELLAEHEVVMDDATYIEETSDACDCDCGCVERLKIGTVIAKQMRQAIFDELRITTSAGIAYNKQLAKLVGSRNKPNKQTVIFDSAVSAFMSGLQSVRQLCGIGQKMAELLESIGIKTVVELQDVSLDMLKKKVDAKTAERLKAWSMGDDNSSVKPSGKPKSLSIEDSTFGCPLKNVYEVETKFSALISKLLVVSAEDGRSPTVFKVTVRKTQIFKELLQRESKQGPIQKNLLNGSAEAVTLNLVGLAMNLFKKMITEKEFKITLLGVSFTKFQEESNQKSSIEKFLCKDVPPPSTSREVKSPKIETKSPKNEVKKSKILEWISKSAESSNSTSSSAPPPAKRPKLNDDTPKIPVPSNVDLDVFNSLPDDVKQELMQKWSRTLSPISTKLPQKISTSKKSTLDRFLKPM